MMPSAPANVERRLSALERQNRRLRSVLVCSWTFLLGCAIGVGFWLDRLGESQRQFMEQQSDLFAIERAKMVQTSVIR